MSDHERGHQEKLKEMEWEKQQNMMEALQREGARQFFSEENFPELDKAFSDRKDYACCMDEGTAHLPASSLDPEHPELVSEFYLAGSGILYPAGSWNERLNRVADLLAGKGVKGVTSHDGCGAAKLAWQRDGGKEGTGYDTPDEYGQKWARDLQFRINERADYQGTVKHLHIKAEQMTRPPEFHAARVVWFDATGKFNPDELGDKIPLGFVIDYGNESKFARTEEEKNYPFKELEVAINIALGDHGFGKKFTQDNPFTIVVISEEETAMEEAKKKIKLMVGQYEGRVKVDGFVKK